MSPDTPHSSIVNRKPSVNRGKSPLCAERRAHRNLAAVSRVRVPAANMRCGHRYPDRTGCSGLLNAKERPSFALRGSFRERSERNVDAESGSGSDEDESGHVNSRFGEMVEQKVPFPGSKLMNGDRQKAGGEHTVAGSTGWRTVTLWRSDPPEVLRLVAERIDHPSAGLRCDEERFEHFNHFGQLIVGLKAARVG